MKTGEQRVVPQPRSARARRRYAQTQASSAPGCSRRPELKPAPEDDEIWLTNSAHLTRTHTCGALRAATSARRSRCSGGCIACATWAACCSSTSGIAGASRRSYRRELLAAPKRLRSEYVVGGARARCERRSADTVNPKLADREVEVVAGEIRVLNEAKTPPFPIADDSTVSEDVRLRYRYLDLRRPRLQYNIGLRHRVDDGDAAVLRRAGLLGDRDADPDEVDARGRARLPGAEPRAPGEFYALPQSPQIFKQILMIGGHRPLLPDREVLPRRGPAGRPPARVHAGGRRDVVRAARDDLRDRSSR